MPSKRYGPYGLFFRINWASLERSNATVVLKLNASDLIGERARIQADLVLLAAKMVAYLGYLSRDNPNYRLESFYQKRSEDFTRFWFGWANSLFGELIVQLYRTRPELLSSLNS